MNELLLCGVCGCPRAVHDNDGECLHCTAFPDRGIICMEYLPQEQAARLLINRDAISTASLLFCISGFLLGAGTMGVFSHEPFPYYGSSILFSVGLFGIIILTLVLERL